MKDDAGLCRTMQDYSRIFRILQNYSRLCRTIQDYTRLFNRSAHSAVPGISVWRLGGMGSVRSGVSHRIGLLGWIGVSGWIVFFDNVLHIFLIFHNFFD